MRDSRDASGWRVMSIRLPIWPPTHGRAPTSGQKCQWTGSIIYHLKDGPVRFNDLARMLGGASKKMIDQRLKELEARGLVTRTVLSERPVAVTYELTSFGASALEILERLRVWSESNEL